VCYLAAGKSVVKHQPIGRWRRVTAAAIAVVLLAFAFEAAEHSVHHLHESDDAASECWVAAAATHTATTAPPVVALVPELPLVVRVIGSIHPTAPVSPSLDADQERGPPSALSL
jgi:hypothetical protein